MGRISEEVRSAIDKRNEEAGVDKEQYRMSGVYEGKIREFEMRVSDMEDILRELEREDVDVSDVQREIRSEGRGII